MSENGEIYTAGKKIYTAAGSDGSDKSHLCAWLGRPLLITLYLFFSQNLSKDKKEEPADVEEVLVQS